MLIHVVRPGDTMWAIAKRYGVDPSVVMGANRAVNPEDMKCGTRLLIPHESPLALAEVARYPVQPGDTLSLIAWRYGVPMATLALANHLQPPYPLRVGQTVLVPMAIAY
jgi:LysM repeat protein